MTQISRFFIIINKSLAQRAKGARGAKKNPEFLAYLASWLLSGKMILFLGETG